MTWQPIYDEKGNPLGHRESIRDVTARKLAEQAAEVRSGGGGDSGQYDGAVVHLDTEGSILWANRRRASLSGWGASRSSACSGMRCRWSGTTVRRAARRSNDGGGERIETEKSTAEGRAWFVQATPLRDQNGGIIGAWRSRWISPSISSGGDPGGGAAGEPPTEVVVEVTDPLADLPPTEP